MQPDSSIRTAQKSALQASAKQPRPSSALVKLLLYLLLVMLGGALLAPVLFSAGKAVLPWLQEHPSGAANWLGKEIQRAHFTRYFNRAVLICALGLIWPFLRSLKVGRELLPRARPWGAGLRLFAGHFALACGLLLLMGGGFFLLGAYQARSVPQWQAVAPALTAALSVSVVEEVLFRTLLLGLLLRTSSLRQAAITGTLLFAAVHFLKPPADWKLADDAVTWTSGLDVLRQISLGFLDVRFLLAEFATLTAVGWVLTQARLRTGQLWASMGLHAGWVFGLKYFSGLVVHQPGWLPWIGENLKIGLAPLLVVLFTGWCSGKIIICTDSQSSGI
jgi:uncharacterized protein